MKIDAVYPQDPYQLSPLWFWEGWCGARDYCPFTMVVRRAIFGATIRHCLRGGLNPDGSSNEEMGTTPDLVSPAEEPPLITALRAIGEA